jgi:hypothetical protein
MGGAYILGIVFPLVVLALDTYEVFRLLDAWLRNTFVPSLPENVRGQDTNGKRATIQLPGTDGGALWQGASVDPETGMLYVPSVTNPYFASLQPGGARSDDSFKGKDAQEMPNLMLPQSKFCVAAATVILLHTCIVATAETVRFNLVSREAVETRLRKYTGDNKQREATLKQMFTEAGCEGQHISEQPVKGSKLPNVICLLPGSSDKAIIVGAHFDRAAMRLRNLVRDVKSETEAIIASALLIRAPC